MSIHELKNGKAVEIRDLNNYIEFTEGDEHLLIQKYIIGQLSLKYEGKLGEKNIYKILIQHKQLSIQPSPWIYTIQDLDLEKARSIYQEILAMLSSTPAEGGLRH